MAYPGEKVYTIDGKKVPETVAYNNYVIRWSQGEEGDGPKLSLSDWRKKQNKTTAKSTGKAGGGAKGPSSTILNPLGSTFGS